MSKSLTKIVQRETNGKVLEFIDPDFRGSERLFDENNRLREPVAPISTGFGQYNTVLAVPADYSREEREGIISYLRAAPFRKGIGVERADGTSTTVPDYQHALDFMDLLRPGQVGKTLFNYKLFGVVKATGPDGTELAVLIDLDRKEPRAREQYNAEPIGLLERYFGPREERNTLTPAYECR
jgi:hypothetical protein